MNAKTKSTSSYIRTISIVWIVFTLLSLILSVQFYTRVISQMENEQLEQGVKELSSAQSKYINSLVENVAAYGETLSVMLQDFATANHMGLQDLAKGKSFFSYYFNRGLVHEIAFLGKDNQLYSVQDLAEENWGNKNWSQAFNGKLVIHSNMKTKDGCTVILFGFPIRIGDSIEGVMLYAYDMENFSKIIDIESFGGQGFGHIIQENGSFIFSSQNINSFTNNQNYFDPLEKLEFSDDNSMETLKKKISQRDTFVAHYKLADSKRVACYRPLDIDDWYLITVTQTTAFKSQFDSKRNSGYITIGVIMAVFVLLVIFILKLAISYTNDMEKAKQYQEVENKKMRLAASQVAGLVFEYTPQENKIEILSGDHSTDDIKPSQNLDDMVSNFILPADADSFKDFLQSSDCDSFMESKDFRLKFQNSNNYSWYRAKLFRISSDPNTPLIGTLQDINDLKTIESQQEKQKRYQSFLLKNTLSLYLINLTSGKIIINSSDSEDINLNQNDTFNEVFMAIGNGLVHPDEKTAFCEMFDRNHLIQKFENGVKELNFTFRKLVNGEYRRTHANMRFVMDEHDGNLLTTIFINDIEDAKREEEKWQNAAWHDNLTGLFNKAAAQERLKTYLANLFENKMHVLFFMDIDNFKHINDTYGHDIGDEALKIVSATIERCFRGTDFVCRWGGDEFLVLMKDVAAEKTAEEKARELIRSFQNIQMEGFPDIKITCSIGFTAVTQPTGDIENLFKAADQALYTAKKKGKNQYFKGDVFC